MKNSKTKLVELTTENITEYKSVLGAEAAENIVRKYYRGIALHEALNMSLLAVLLWEKKQQTAEISAFYMKDDEAGKALLAAYKEAIFAEDMTDTVIELPAEGSEAVCSLLREMGFHLQERESNEICLSVDELSQLPVMETQNVTSEIRSIGSLTLPQMQKGLIRAHFGNKTGKMLTDLTALPVSWFEPDISCCVLQEGIVNGLLLIHKTETDRLAVQLMYIEQNLSQVYILRMIQFAVKRAREKYPADTQVVVKCCNPEIKAFTEKLFRKKSEQIVIRGEKSER